MGKGYTVKYTFGYHLPSFIMLTCFTVTGVRQMAREVSLYDRFKFGFIKLARNDEVYAKNTCHSFYSLAINKISDVENQWQCESGLALYSMTSYTVSQFLIHDNDWVAYGPRPEELVINVRSLLGWCDNNEGKVHIIGLPAIERRLLLSAWCCNAQPRIFAEGNSRSPRFLALVIAS